MINMPVLTSVNRAAAKRLKTQWESIQFLTQNLSTDDLQLQAEGGKWSVKDQLAHLGRYQEIFLIRINRILAEDTPEFRRYTSEEDAGFNKWTEKSLDSILECIRYDRGRIYELVLSIQAEGLDRTGVHPKFGAMNIPMWVEFFLLHEAHHLYSIFQLVNHH